MHKPKPTKSAGKGTIQKGDSYGYMGHYRSPDSMKRGHNQGAPGMDLTHPMFNPLSNPQGFAAATQGAPGLTQSPRRTPASQGTVTGPGTMPTAGKGPGYGMRGKMTMERGGGMQTPYQTAPPLTPGERPMAGPVGGPKMSAAGGQPMAGPVGGPKAIGARQQTMGARQQLQQSLGNLRQARGGAGMQKRAPKARKQGRY